MALTVYDSVRIAAFSVIMVVLAFQKTRRFLFVDFLLTSTMATVYLFRPSLFQRQLNIEFDAFHFWLWKAASGASLFYSLFYFFFVRTSRDDDSSYGLLACRTVVQGLATVMLSVNHWRFPKLFNETFFMSMILLSLVWTCLGAYHIYRTGINFPRRGRVYPINRYIKIDIVLLLLLAGSDFLFASYTLQSLSWKMDNLHVHLTTACGLLSTAAAILGVYALGFRNVAERKGYLCCRITVVLFLVLTYLYALVVQKLPQTNSDIAVMMTMLIPAIPATAGLVLTGDRRSFSSSSTGYNLRARSS